MTVILIILFDYRLTLHIAHTYVHAVYLHTQQELSHCDIFYEIYDNFAEIHTRYFYLNT